MKTFLSLRFEDLAVFEGLSPIFKVSLIKKIQAVNNEMNSSTPMKTPSKKGKDKSFDLF